MGPHFEKTLSNVAETRARGGAVIAVTTPSGAERIGTGAASSCCAAGCSSRRPGISI
jgi:glucosamine 6-phosphate synthetase-like amidotransferase/phosphosugar isomerase protein